MLSFYDIVGFSDHPANLSSTDRLLGIGIIAAICLLAYFLLKKIVFPLVKRFTEKTDATWDDHLFNSRVLNLAAYLLPALLAYMFVPMLFSDHPMTVTVIDKAFLLLIVAISTRLVCAFISSFQIISSESELLRKRPLTGIYQTFKILVVCVGIILAVSILLNREPSTILAGLGASAAVLMLVFKDSIMGFVSGVQLSANDMLKVGDWIAMPKYGADGTVIEVTLNTVKVRNWDNTITTIPPYLLVSDSFQNWRGMRESGGRRVKRSINIDMNSVRFCTPEMLDKYRKIRLLKDYVEQTEAVIEEYNKKHHIDNSVLVNGRRQTNLGVFRAYLTAYLKSLPDVNKELTCMVRQLQPTDHGIPMELYFFCAIKDWVPYEGVQADVFDHVLAIIPEFDLQVFQSPSGRDFQRVLS